MHKTLLLLAIFVGACATTATAIEEEEDPGAAGGAVPGTGGAKGGSAGKGGGGATGGGTVDSGVAPPAKWDVLGGYVTTGPWMGYAWSAGIGTGVSIQPADFSAAPTGGPLCVSGSVPPSADSGNSGMLGINLNQDSLPLSDLLAVTPTSEGVTINVTNRAGTTLRVMIQGPNGATDPAQRWCTSLIGSGGFIPWTDFRTACWTTTGTAYAKQPIAAIIVQAPGDATTTRTFDFCVDNLVDGKTGTGPTSGGKGTLTGSYDSQPVLKDGKTYIVQNNVWGGAGVKQTVTFDGTSFTVTEQTGNSGSGTPVSFPSVFVGSNNGRSTPGWPLPKAISQIASIPTVFTHNAGSVSGTYNAAYDVWFSTSAAGDAASPSGGYVMVWLYKPGGAQPIGGPAASGITIAGVSGTWDVWEGNNGSVPCVSFVSQTQLQTLSFDLNAFIRSAVGGGKIQSGWYLTNIFAGFEIWSGGVGLQTLDFSVTVN